MNNNLLETNMDRATYEARCISSFNNAMNEFERDEFTKRITYPKTTSDAMAEVRHRGYDPDGGRLQRWVDSRPKGEAPPKMKDIRGTSQAWERHHIDSFIARLEQLKAFTPDGEICRKFRITEDQISKAVMECSRKMKEAGKNSGGYFGVFYWEGELTALPLDQIFAIKLDRPLGAFVKNVYIMSHGMAENARISFVMSEAFNGRPIPEYNDLPANVKPEYDAATYPLPKPEYDVPKHSFVTEEAEYDASPLATPAKKAAKKPARKSKK